MRCLNKLKVGTGDEAASESKQISVFINDYLEGRLEEGDITISDGERYADSVRLNKLKEGWIIEVYLQGIDLGDGDFGVEGFDPSVIIWAIDSLDILNEADDDSGHLSSSYLRVTVPQDGDYNIIITSFETNTEGPWQLWFIVYDQNGTGVEHVLFDPSEVEENSGDGDSGSDDCYFRYCGTCKWFEYTTCSCVIRLDCPWDGSEAPSAY